MISKIKNLLLPLIIIIAGFSSCYPVGDLTVEDLDVAATIYDKAYYDGPDGTMNKFEDLHTFTVVDTIVHLVESGTEDNISRAYDDFVLEQVRLNMLKLGFVEELNPQVNPADVAITVSAMSSTHEVYTWYPYWGWYWGYPYKSTETQKSYQYLQLLLSLVSLQHLLFLSIRFCPDGNGGCSPGESRCRGNPCYLGRHY